MASPTNPVNPTRANPTDANPTDANPTDANPTDANPTDANLKPYSKYVIQCADFIFWRKPQLKIRGMRIYCAFNCHTLGQPFFVPRFVSYQPRSPEPYLTHPAPLSLDQTSYLLVLLPRHCLVLPHASHSGQGLLCQICN